MAIGQPSSNPMKIRFMSRRLGLGRAALGLSFSSSEALPILLRAASRTLTPPFACILCFSAAVMLRTSGFALLSVASPI